MEKKKLITIISVVAAVVILIAAVSIAYVIKSGNDSFDTTGQSETEGATEELASFPELKIIAVTERDRDVLVETTYGNFTYPFAFSDIINVKSVNNEGSAQLQILGNIDKEELALYTIHYNKEQGIGFGSLKIEGYDEPVSVCVEFADAPDGLEDNWLDTYNAAQETFNDVRVSMTEDANFTSVKQ